MPTGTYPSRHTPPIGSRFSRRLGPHHFAYLRAIAEGLDRQDCARRYLGIEHGHEAVTAHRLVVDQVRAAARRRGETSARLIGLTIRVSDTGWTTGARPRSSSCTPSSVARLRDPTRRHSDASGCASARSSC